MGLSKSKASPSRFIMAIFLGYVYAMFRHTHKRKSPILSEIHIVFIMFYDAINYIYTYLFIHIHNYIIYI